MMIIEFATKGKLQKGRRKRGTHKRIPLSHSTVTSKWFFSDFMVGSPFAVPLFRASKLTTYNTYMLYLSLSLYTYIYIYICIYIYIYAQYIYIYTQRLIMLIIHNTETLSLHVEHIENLICIYLSLSLSLSLSIHIYMYTHIYIYIYTYRLLVYKARSHLRGLSLDAPARASRELWQPPRKPFSAWPRPADARDGAPCYLFCLLSGYCMLTDINRYH